MFGGWLSRLLVDSMGIEMTILELIKGHVSRDMVPFSLGELHGPAKCEHEGCCDEAWFIWMTPEEYEAVKKQKNPTLHVFENKIGIALCEKHD